VIDADENDFIRQIARVRERAHARHASRSRRDVTIRVVTKFDGNIPHLSTRAGIARDARSTRAARGARARGR
jgi:hypothetical protein